MDNYPVTQKKKKKKKHPCCQQCLCWRPQTFLTLQCPLPCAYGRRVLTYLSTLPGKQSSMCMPTLHQSSASIPQQIALFFYFFFFWVGELFITHTWTCNEPPVSTGRPSTAEVASNPHYLGRGRHKSLQRSNMSGKTSSPQGSCSPAHSQAYSFSTNKASPLSESTQHSCQDHKYNEVPSKASSRQDSCSPSICQARFISLDKRQAHA